MAKRSCTLLLFEVLRVLAVEKVDCQKKGPAWRIQRVTWKREGSSPSWFNPVEMEMEHLDTPAKTLPFGAL